MSGRLVGPGVGPVLLRLRVLDNGVVQDARGCSRERSEVPGPSLELSIFVVDYHIDRNKVARQSRQDLMGSAQESQTPSAVGLITGSF